MSAPLYLCLYVRDFAAQTLVRLRPELRKRPVVILDGDPPLETVFALNERARNLGLALGVSRLQAESFDGISVSSRLKQQEDSAFLILTHCGERISPRIEVLASPQESSSGATLIQDVSASERLFGTPEQIATALRRNMDAAGFEACIATSGNAYAAVLAARGFRGTTIIPPGKEATTLASLPLAVLQLEPEQQETFASWGIKTLGALAALPQKALIARIGQAGYRLLALSRAEYQHLLVPAEPLIDAILSERTELEHPVDLLEPLLFLLGRMLEQIIARAAERALAIAYVETRLVLEGGSSNEHRRVVRPALPEYNPHTLLKLIQLDLEMYPPEAAVIALYMQAQPARPQTGQQGYRFPSYPVPDGDTMQSFLEKRVEEGLRERYLQKRNHKLFEKAQKQARHELALIGQLELAGYFLIVWDIVQFCRREGILVQGRGSAANSVVCYSLGITAVDPVGMELLFERFLSAERGEWPDIDLDLPSGDRRERAIQYVYQRYGELGAAMTANVITYGGKSAAREAGKALGFDADTLERLTKLVGAWEWKGPTDTLDASFRTACFDTQQRRIAKYLEICERMQDIPRHLGQHSGGMVICAGQLNAVVPLERASMPGRTVIQWDKEDCADMKIIKVDLLGLGMMAVLEDCLDLVPRYYKEPLDLAQLPQDDPEVYRTLQRADTVGMFQVESRAQMSALPRNRPVRFYDLVVQVAIIRPGPIVGKMMNPYMKRRQGKEAVTYAHPLLEPVLKRTLGVPLFQEQLIRMSMIVANFSGGESEELRRAMGMRRSQARMRELEIKLRQGMTANGIRHDAQEQIIQSIASFALWIS